MKTLKRRKKEHKTDYLKRLKLLKSERPRVIFRKTNKSLVVQYVKSDAAQDKIIFGITSKELLKHGWEKEFSGSLKSIPASYLTGYFVSKKIKNEKLETPIVDLGMQRVIKKSALFAFIKGLIDGGLEIECDEENFPEEERLNGESTKENLTKIIKGVKSNLDKE